MKIGTLEIVATPEHIAETDWLGNEIAELSAHLEAAGAHLLDLIREFDARGGWNRGFRSCAQWLAWRVEMERRWDEAAGLSLDVVAYAAPQKHTPVFVGQRMPPR